MLSSAYQNKWSEAGCDEAGRGCIAGPVFAAAVIFPHDYCHAEINDSKTLPVQKRERLREVIMRDAISWAVASIEAPEIDRINILRSSIQAMHLAIAQLNPAPELILVDGNRFEPFPGIPHLCIIKGDGIYLSIAAASILAKTARDEAMYTLHQQYPEYGWDRNKGYPSPAHRKALAKYGISPFHRKSYKTCRQTLFNMQGSADIL